MYNDVGPALIAYQIKKTPEDMTDHQYLNILSNSIIDYETWESLEYIRLIKRDKHKNKWVKYFSNELVRLSQGIGDIVKGAYVIISWKMKDTNR